MTQPGHKNRKYLLITAVTVIVAVVITAFIYHRQVASLKTKLDSANAAAASLTKQKTDLTAKNNNLTSATKALQEQVSNSDGALQATDIAGTGAGSEKDVPVQVPKPAGEMEIVQFRKGKIEEFVGPNDQYHPTGDILILYVKIKNTSGITHNYSQWDFKAITANGEAIDSRMYLPAASLTWNNSDLVDGGSKEVPLIYPVDTNIVSLQWKVPGGTTTLTAPVPAVEE